MPTIDGQRVVADLRRLAEFGRYKTGVHRPTYSPVDVESRHWLAEKLGEAGLDPIIDGIGNVIGRHPSARLRLLVGSHSETQPYGGWLDGSLGVIYGIELARAFAADPSCAGLGIDVAAWADEEGHYESFLGSHSFTGALSEEQIERVRGRDDGTPLREALQRAGLAGRPRERVEPGHYVGYLEAHIEQGETLESAGLAIGIVTSIVGIWQYKISFDGEQNHAGTTRMAIRRDAGLALARFCVEIDDRFPSACGPRTVWTTGQITLDPGAPSIIPGHAEMLFQMRDADPAVVARLEDLLRSMAADVTAQGRCSVAVECIRTGAPAIMDGAFQEAIERASADFAGGRSIRMPSGAGHDTQILATIMPAGMLFVPSIGGISHHWTENTADADIVTGAQVFVETCRRLLAR
jgi:N-carbamoyl-L-amino-acid hydrolase